MDKKPRFVLKKTLRILLWVGVSIASFLILLIVAVQIPSVQNYIKDKAITYLNEKIKTKSSLDKIYISFPKNIVVEGFYFEDQKKDTLLSGKRLEVDIDLFKLLSNEVEINSIELENATANISRNKNAVFNFDYIIKAFASNTPKDTTGKPFKISVVKINLSAINFSFKDDLSKNDVKVKLKHFETNFKKMDLDKMDFNIPNIYLDGLKVVLNQDLVEKIAEVSVKTVDTISKRNDFSLKLNKIKLSNINVLYDNKGSKLNSGLAFDQLNLTVNQIDLQKQLLDFNAFKIKNLKANLIFGKKDEHIKTPDLDSTSIAQKGWKIKMKSIDLENVAFKFDDMKSPPLKKGIDYSHLDLNQLHLKAQKLYYHNLTASGNINSFAVNEKSGLKIQELRTNFFYGPKGSSLENLYLKTPKTLLRNKAIVKYESLASISKNLGNLFIYADLNQSKIAFHDILIVAPQLENTNPFKSNPNAVVYLNAKVSGKLNNLNIPYFQMHGIGNTKASFSGKINGLPDMKKAFFDLNIKNLESTSHDVVSFVPKGTIPKNIQLPSRFNVNGKFKGSMANFQTKLALQSSYGTAKVDGFFDQRIKNKEKYDAEISFTAFDLGKLIKNDSIGKITLKAKTKGTGLNPKTANAQLNLIVNQASYNKYTYRNLNLNGKIASGLYNLKSNMSDPNLTFKLDANGDSKNKYPAIKLNLNLDIADLEKLNLHAGPMKLRGNVVADIANSNPDFLNGNVFLSNIQILKDKEPIVLDSIKIFAFSDNEKNNIKISSQFLKAELDGKYKLTTLSSSLKKSLSKYMDLQTTKDKANTDQQRFTFNLAVENDPVLFQIIPKLTGLEPLTISAKYNNAADSLLVSASIPKLVYAENTITGAVFNAEAKENALEYKLSVDAAESAGFKFPFAVLSGKIENNIIDYALQINDNAKKEKYYVAGQLEHANDENIFKIDPEKLILNYESWTVNPENTIEFGKNGLYVNQFELSNSGNHLKIQSQQNQKNAPIDIQFLNFKIETILNMANKEDLLMQGLINGSATVENLSTQPIFTSDLKVDNFVFHGEEVGNLSLKVDKSANTLTANMTLSGNENKVDIAGKYLINESSLDFNAAINHLNIKSIQGFSMGNLTDGSGSVSGDFKITGNATAPKVNGDLNFDDAAFRITKLNSYFKMANEKIHFDNDGIALNHLAVQDENDNKLEVDGKLLTNDFRNFNFDLVVTADNFRAVHSKEKDNDQFYGDLFLDSKLKIKGTLDNPIVNGNIKIKDKTKFSVVMPQSDPSIADREGIVEFVDEENIYLKQTVKLQNELNQSKVRSMDVNVTISADKEAQLTLVIDKANGDFLTLKGEAELTAGIDPAGKTSLTGKYEVNDGTYEMNFNMIKREFKIQKGSYVIWNGEPTLANINITAIYKTEAAPIDLLGNELATVSTTIKNTYKQRIEFETLLKLNGELLKPDISFDITIPDGNYEVSPEVINTTKSKLDQLRENPSDMNKQVFALLLLNRFVGENPFASEAGGTSAEAMARQSVSKLLSQQLNDIAGGMVAGFQLEFDLESTEDYTSGSKDNRTDLNVGISKKLLNDRLKVTIGSSFGIEGDERANSDAANIAGDVSLEYQVTRDGRYVLKGYRKNEYQVAIQGEIVETGVAFIITMSYNKFEELFKRTAEEKAIIEKEKQLKKKKAEEKKHKSTLGISL
jgi:hypothetical protein